MNSNSLQTLLRERFQLQQFRPGQLEAIEQTLKGRDVLLILPTGAGKSLCYQLPAVARDGLVLVISPLIALMKDQVDRLTTLGIPATFINSSITMEEQHFRIDQMRAGAYRLLYVAPERFRSRFFTEALAGREISLFAVDEAHCVSQWGHDFRPDYLRLKKVIERLGHPPTIALTATATPDVKQDIGLHLGLREPFVLVSGFDRPNLQFVIRNIRTEQEKDLEILDYLKNHEGMGIIYCSTIRRVDQLAEVLQQQGVKALPYHSQIETDRRKTFQEKFMKGDIRVMVATNAFGLGIDKPNIRFVFHYNLPATLEAYYQEAGRGGRDGIASDAILFFSLSDRYTHEFLIDCSYPPREVIEQVFAYLCTQPEDPILLTAETIADKLGNRITDKSVYSALNILETSGLIEKLSGRHSESWVTFLQKPSPETVREGTQRLRLLEYIFDIAGVEPGKRITFNLDEAEAQTELTTVALRRALGELGRDGVIYYEPPFRGRGVRVIKRDLADLSAEVDFESNDLRREHELQKLEKIIRFCGATSCRRAWLLKYFGEDTDLVNCGNCDWCLRSAPAAEGQDTKDPLPAGELKPNELVVIQKALSCVARMKGGFGRNMIIDVLRGSKRKKIFDASLERLSTYGLLSELSKDELKRIFDLLEADGCFEKNREFRTLSLSKRGDQIMKQKAAPGSTSLGLTDPEKTPEPEAEKPLEVWQQLLYEKIRQLRNRMADEAGLEPYRIFNNGALDEMARLYPRNKNEMLKCRGVGSRLFGLYGDVFLAAIQEHIQEQGIELPAAPLPAETAGLNAAAEPGRELDEDLYLALRELRYGLATDAGIPPYMVFSDKALKGLAERLPATDEEMLEVPGVGQKLLERFGVEFLGAIRSYVSMKGGLPEMREQELEPAGVDGAGLVRESASQLAAGASLREMLDEGWRLERIAEFSGQNLASLVEEIVSLNLPDIKRRLDDWLPHQRTERIRSALPDDQEGVEVQDLQEILPDTIEAWEIRLVLETQRAHIAEKAGTASK